MTHHGLHQASSSHLKDAPDGKTSNELKKDFDNTIKGNVYQVENGQRVVVNPSASDKKDKVEVVHRYLVLQIFIGSGESFQLELQVRDKSNVSQYLITICFRIAED